MRFPYSTPPGRPKPFPWLPITLSTGKRSISTFGLIDSAATVNVLPYQMGEELGAIWDEQTITMDLSGNLAHLEARGLLVIAHIDGFQPVQLGFAWTQSETVPLILGQVNFFESFDICFFRTEFAFEISSKNVS
jgi:hypothetical protein